MKFYESVAKINQIKPFGLSLVKLKTISFGEREGFYQGAAGPEDAKYCV